MLPRYAESFAGLDQSYGNLVQPEQIVENVKAIDVIPLLTPEIMAKIEGILDNKPAPLVSFCLFYTL